MKVSRLSGFHDGHATVHGKPNHELKGSNAAKERGGCTASTSRLMFVTLMAVPTESAAGQDDREVWSFPRSACSRATLGA